jgi:hypothetical protein
MISENTVIILGAGASKPYGYPTALELREEIIYKFLPQYDTYMREYDISWDSHKNNYIKIFSQLIDTFKKSSTSSIDLFLSRNPSYYVTGKYIIAFLLAKHEVESKFREDITERKYDWYSALYNILTNDITTQNEVNKFTDNKLSIITFNYDRSFENFIYESLYNSFTRKQPKIFTIMNKMEIIHVYGKLARLEWEDSSGIAYGSNQIIDNSEYCANNIKIIYEERPSVQEEITKLLTEAINIYFLGFGYGEENMEAIGLNKIVFRTEQRIYGTALGLKEREISKNISLLRKNSPDMIVEKFQLEDCDSFTLLRNNLIY